MGGVLVSADTIAWYVTFWLWSCCACVGCCVMFVVDGVSVAVAGIAIAAAAFAAAAVAVAASAGVVVSSDSIDRYAKLAIVACVMCRSSCCCCRCCLRMAEGDGELQLLLL